MLGIGSDLRGDDEAGMSVLKLIRKAGHLRLFYGGTAPENLTGDIRRFEPTHLIMVDSVEMGRKAGSIVLLSADDVKESVSFSTHKMPVRVMTDYLSKSFGCEFIIVGIQPKTIEFGAGMSGGVKAAVKRVASAINAAVKNTTS